MKWISVEDRLPESLMLVLINCGGTAVNIGYYNEDEKVWYFQYNKENWSQNITRWMPLPPTPEKGEKQ